MAERFKELAEERFPGRVSVEVYPSAQLMEDTEAIEALAFGEVQMIATSLSLYDRLTPKFQVFDLPFLFPNLPAVERFQRSEAGRELLGCARRARHHGPAVLAQRHEAVLGPAADRRAAGCRGAQVSRHGVGHPASADRGRRRQPAEDGIRRGVPGAANRHRRRAREHLVEHLLVEVLRSAAVHHREQSRLHRLLRRRELRVLAVVARRSARGARSDARGSDGVGQRALRSHQHRRSAAHRRLGPLRRSRC